MRRSLRPGQKARGRNAATVILPKEDGAHKSLPSTRVLVSTYTLKKSTTFLSYVAGARKPQHIVILRPVLKLGLLTSSPQAFRYGYFGGQVIQSNAAPELQKLSAYEGGNRCWRSLLFRGCAPLTLQALPFVIDWRFLGARLSRFPLSRSICVDP